MNKKPMISGGLFCGRINEFFIPLTYALKYSRRGYLEARTNAYSHKKTFVFMFAHHSEEENGIGTIAQCKNDFFPKHFLRNDPVLHDGFREELMRFVSVLSADKRAIENKLE